MKKSGDGAKEDMTQKEEDVKSKKENEDVGVGGSDDEDEELSEHDISRSSSGTGSCDIPNDREIEELLNVLNEPCLRYDWTTFAIRAGMTTFLYPGQMAQILMQVGYEPFPPRTSVTLLGRPCLLLPSTGTYLRYMYQVDGFVGIFHGLTPRICQQLVFTYVFDRTRCYFRKRHVRNVFAKAQAAEIASQQAITANDSNQSRLTEESEQSETEIISSGFIDHFRDLGYELCSKLTAIVATYPLQVVVIRTIAQFVGREHCTRSLLGEIQAVYQDFGVMGFYRGLVPKLIGETCQTVAVGTLTYFVSNQTPTIELRSLLNLSFSVLISAWTYQFSVVSTTMAVNGSCLKAGRPPIQPLYDNWIHCWKELKELNVLHRGSSIFCRYYTGPTMMVSGMKTPTGVTFGPNHLSYKMLSDAPFQSLETAINIQSILYRIAVAFKESRRRVTTYEVTFC